MARTWLFTHSYLGVLENTSEVTAFCEQPMHIKCEGTDWLYCPDVAGVTRDQIPFLVEVKPEANMTSGSVLQKTLSALKYSSEFGCPFIMTNRKGHRIVDLFARSVPEAVRIFILERLNGRKSLSYRECAKCLEDVPKTDRRRMISILAVKYDLSFSMLPNFSISPLAEGLSWSDLIRIPPELVNPVS